MCKHALTRLPLISPWAALTSVFWVSDKAVLVLCCFSPTKYWTDLKVAISFFFYLSRWFHTREKFTTIGFKSLFHRLYISWKCYLKLSVVLWYRLPWTLHALFVQTLKLPPWWIIQRQPPILGDVFICTGLNWERDLRRFIVNSLDPNRVRPIDPPLRSIVSWTLNFLFPPEWSERTKSDSQAFKEGAAFNDQVDCSSLFANIGLKTHKRRSENRMFLMLSWDTTNQDTSFVL